MKLLLVIPILLTAIGCKQKSEKIIIEKSDWQELNKVTEKTVPKKNLEQLIQEGGSFLQGDTLILCCYDDYLNPFASVKRSIMAKTKVPFNGDSATLYNYNSSYLKYYFNSHPEVNKLVFSNGYISDSSLIVKKYFWIGQSKNDFLNLFFETTHLYENINIIELSENEISKTTSQFRFVDDQLTEIIFTSF